MRRIRALFVLAALLTLVLPASAQAGSLTRESDTRVSLFCEDVTAGNAHLFLFAETSARSAPSRISRSGAATSPVSRIWSTTRARSCSHRPADQARSLSLS